MSSYLYQIQESIEETVKSVLPDGVEIITRRKGNVANDISNSLSKIGVAIVVSPPLPTKFLNGWSFGFDELELDVSIVENVLLKKATIETNAYELLETIAEKLHQCRPLDRAITTLSTIIDNSPDDKPYIAFTLTIKIK